MPKFKVGDKVRYIRPQKWLKGTGDRTIFEITLSNYYFNNGKHIAISQAEEVGGEFEMELVERNNEEVIDMSCKTKWEFNSVAHTDVDWDEIVNSLSRQHPIALVNADGFKFDNVVDESTGIVTEVKVPHSMYYVVVHDSLLSKSQAIGMELPESHEHMLNVYLLKDVNSFVVFVNWAKKVKKAKWPDEIRDVRKFTVTLPTI